jgi:hypothetical protein
MSSEYKLTGQTELFNAIRATLRKHEAEPDPRIVRAVIENMSLLDQERAGAESCRRAARGLNADVFRLRHETAGETQRERITRLVDEAASEPALPLTLEDDAGYPRRLPTNAEASSIGADALWELIHEYGAEVVIGENGRPRIERGVHEPDAEDGQPGPASGDGDDEFTRLLDETFGPAAEAVTPRLVDEAASEPEPCTRESLSG